MGPALDEARRASALADWLTKIEPRNTEWKQVGTNSIVDRARLELAAGHIAEARRLAVEACNAAAQLLAQDRSVAAWRTKLSFNCLTTKARIALASGQADEATSLSSQALTLARADRNPVDRALAVARAEMLLGDALRRAGQSGASNGAYERAFAAWPKSIEERPVDLADHVTLLRRLRRDSDAAVLARRLSTMGYGHPDYVRG